VETPWKMGDSVPKEQVSLWEANGIPCITVPRDEYEDVCRQLRQLDLEKEELARAAQRIESIRRANDAEREKAAKKLKKWAKRFLGEADDDEDY
jgi:molecular chaperone GrpE (heat shock protein)